MHATSLDDQTRAAGHGASFNAVLCGVDGSPTSLEAARQAATICVPRGSLRVIAVTWEKGMSPNDNTAVSRWRADRALSEARTIALDLGIEPHMSEASAEDPATYLLEQADGCDLIAVGVHGRSRTGGGIALGRTASALLHRSPLPVLVARRPPADDFGESVLLAVDGTPSCLTAADVAGRVAVRTGGHVAIVSAPGHDEATRQTLAEAARRLLNATGRNPVVLDETGPAHRAVAAAAVAIGASVVVTGSRGLTGVEALHSVSERIARTAPCSVLVVRGRTG
jgi:nucleotide-binding universal stress UspA family protein